MIAASLVSCRLYVERPGADEEIALDIEGGARGGDCWINAVASGGAPWAGELTAEERATALELLWEDHQDRGDWAA